MQGCKELSPLKILDNDCDLLERVSKELMEDEEFKQYLKDNFDLD